MNLQSSLRYLSRRVWLLFAIVSIAFAMVILRFPPSSLMSLTNGDEPHYLLTAHSLYYDHDIATSNNYRNQDYRYFYDGETLAQHLYLFKGRLVPYHPMLGLPLLIVLPYALAGRIGVLLWLSLIMALGLTMLYHTVRTYVPARLAFATVLFCGLTYPLLIYSHQIYPDALAFTLVSFTLWQIIAPPAKDQRVTALLVGVALGLLPHFHFKFALLAAVLYLFFLGQSRQRLLLRLVWSLGPILVLAGLFVVWIYTVYGEFSSAVFITSSRGEFASGRFDGVIGLWFDQEYGLFFFAPFYGMAAIGAWAFWHVPATRRTAFFLSLLYASQHLLAASFYDWHGGLSPVPRYLVSVLPVLIIFAAKGVELALAQRQWSQPLGLALGTLWVTRLIVFVRRPWMFGYEQGSNTILRDHYHLTWLIQLLPSFQPGHSAAVYLRLGGLLLLLLALWWLGGLFNRWTSAVTRLRAGL